MKSEAYSNQLKLAREHVAKCGYIDLSQIGDRSLNRMTIDRNLRHLELFFQRIIEIPKEAKPNRKKSNDIQSYSSRIADMGYTNKLDFRRFNPIDFSETCILALNYLEKLTTEDYELLFKIVSASSNIKPLAAFYEIYQSAKLSFSRNKRINTCINFIEKYAEDFYQKLYSDLQNSTPESNFEGPASMLYKHLTDFVKDNEDDELNLKVWGNMGGHCCLLYIEKIHYS